MTTKTSRAIFFVLIGASLIIPFSAIGINEATALSDKQLIVQHSKNFLKLEEEKRNVDKNLDDARKNKNSKTSDILLLEQQSTKLQQDLDKIADEVEKINQRNREAMKLDSVLEQRLTNAQQKITDSKEISWSLVFVDPKSKTLSVSVSDEASALAVKKLIPDVPISITIDDYRFTGCTSPTAYCNPLMGRLQIVGNGDGGCTLSLPAWKGTTRGL